jgi:hypothetical protein
LLFLNLHDDDNKGRSFVNDILTVFTNNKYRINQKWELGVELVENSMQSVPITIVVVSSNLDQGEVYNNM